MLGHQLIHPPFLHALAAAGHGSTRLELTAPTHSSS